MKGILKLAQLFRNQLLIGRVNYSLFGRNIFKMAVSYGSTPYCSNIDKGCGVNSNSKKSFLFCNYFIPTDLQFRMYAKKMGGKKPKGGKAKAHLTDEEMMDVVDVSEYRNELEAIINKLKADFVAHLSLRMSSGSIESLMIKIEADEYPLNELAQISRKNPNLISINMSGFPEGLKPTLQAIVESGLGLNPQQEGTMIYLPIPKVTHELREKLAKNAKTLFMKAKDEIRNVQNNYIRDAKQQTELSEDLVFSTTQQLAAIAEDFASEAEKILKMKQKDLLGES